MAAINLLGKISPINLEFVESNFPFSVIFAISAGFLGLKGPLWTLVFLYVFAGYAFFLVNISHYCSAYISNLLLSYVHFALSSYLTPRMRVRQMQPPQLPKLSVGGASSSCFLKHYCRSCTWDGLFAYKIAILRIHLYN